MLNDITIPFPLPTNQTYGMVWYGNPNCTIREATAAARHILFGALCIICALRRLDKYIHIHLVHNIYGRMCVSVFLFFVVFSIPTQSLLWFRGVSIEIYKTYTQTYMCSFGSSCHLLLLLLLIYTRFYEWIGMAGWVFGKTLSICPRLWPFVYLSVCLSIHVSEEMICFTPFCHHSKETFSLQPLTFDNRQ